MIKNGFTINDWDKCVYSKKFRESCILVCRYVNNMLILGTNIEIINKTKKMFTNNFDMKDIGEADLILKIKLSKTLDGTILPQTHYINIVIARFKIHGINEFNNQFPPYVVLQKNTENDKQQLEYFQILENVMHLMN